MSGTNLQYKLAVTDLTFANNDTPVAIKVGTEAAAREAFIAANDVTDKYKKAVGDAKYEEDDVRVYPVVSGAKLFEWVTVEPLIAEPVAKPAKPTQTLPKNSK